MLDTRHAVVREWVEGVPLSELVAENGPRLTQTLALHIAFQVARALTAAHELEDGAVTHGALDLTHVICGKDGSVKVCNFGGGTVRDGRLRAHPAFVPPEVMGGEVADVDTARGSRGQGVLGHGQDRAGGRSHRRVLRAQQPGGLEGPGHQLGVEHHPVGVPLLPETGGGDGRAQPAEDDLVLEQDGYKVFIDPFSAQYISGVVVDYVTSMQGSGFTFKNPNATGGCGCGSSFSA